MSNQNWRERDFLSRKDIADILGISNGAAYEIVHQLPHVKVGKVYRVSTKAFQEWIKTQERTNAR